MILLNEQHRKSKHT